MDYDFSKMVYNTLDLKDNETILDKYPELSEFNEFRFRMERFPVGRIYKFISLVYDKGGLFQYHNDPEYRKRLALQLSGLDDPKLHRESVHRLTSGKEPAVSLAIFRYIRVQKSPSFTFLMSMMNSYSKLIEKMNTEEIGDKDYKFVKTLKLDIEAEVELFLNREKELLLKDDLWIYLDLEQTASLRPEAIATLLASGKIPISVKPYGENYSLSYYE